MYTHVMQNNLLACNAAHPMNALLKRHSGSFASLNFRTGKYLSASEFQILDLCKSGSLADAILCLNSTASADISVKPNVYASLLRTCIKALSFTHGLQIHAHVVKSGLDTDRYVGNSLLSLYFKLGHDFRETRKVFNGLFVKDVISWTSMICGYLRVGNPHSSLVLFFEMLDYDIEPNAFTLSAVIKACSEIGDLRLARCFHGAVVTGGFGTSPVISSSLIDMYGRNHEPEDAHRLFDEMPEPDAICWTSVVSAYSRNDLYKEALELFYCVHRSLGLIPDGFMFGTVLMACGNLMRLRQGRELHAKLVTSGCCGNTVVESSLVDMYGKCGAVREAQCAFNRMPARNAVSWSALLGGYCQNRDYGSVIRIFREMEEKDLYSFGTVIRACTGLAAARHGKEVHCQYVRKVGRGNVIVESALVDLYAKCGCVDFAYKIFSEMPFRNMITWNTMIFGFAQNGRGEDALTIFDGMVNRGITKPDSITFIGVLFACSHAGLVHRGREYFASMAKDYGVRAGAEHYSCMIDLLGRAGLLEEAEDLIESSEFRDDPYLWGVFLGACTACKNSTTAERVAKRMMELEPRYHLSYVLLANVYKAVGKHNDASKIRKLMEDRGVAKMSGKSWIETNKLLGSYFETKVVNATHKQATILSPHPPPPATFDIG